MRNTFETKSGHRPVVAAFGPTSKDEISLSAGIKLTPKEDCRCFYAPRCLETRSCLERIPPGDWERALEAALDGAAIPA